MEASPLDKLKTTTLGDLTQTQIHDTAATTFVSRPGATRIAREIHEAKLAISTYGGNGIIPDSGGFEQVEFTDAPPTGTAMQPPAGQVWRIDLTDINIVNGSAGSNTVSLKMTDGITSNLLKATAIAGGNQDGKMFDIEKTPSKVEYFTNSLYLAVVGTSSDASTAKVPFTKVAL